MVLADLDSKEEMLLNLFTAVVLLDPTGWLTLLWETGISI